MQRILKFDAPSARGLWWAPLKRRGAIIIKPLQPPWRAKEKQANRPAGVGNTPLFPLCGTSPGGGSLLASVFSANLSCSFYSIARTSPSGGGKRTKFVGSHKATENFVRRFPVERCRRQKGCISDGRQPGLPVFQRPPGARLSDFIIRGVFYDFKDAHHRREAALGSFPMKELGEALRIGPGFMP